MQMHCAFDCYDCLVCRSHAQQCNCNLVLRQDGEFVSRIAPGTIGVRLDWSHCSLMFHSRATWQPMLLVKGSLASERMLAPPECQTAKPLRPDFPLKGDLTAS